MPRSPLARDALAAVREMRGHALRGLSYEEVRAGWMGARRGPALAGAVGQGLLRARSEFGPPASPPPPVGSRPGPDILYPGSLVQPDTPAVCNCWRPSDFDTSCMCGAESVTCVSRNGYCYCSGTCKQGKISEYDGEIEWCVGGQGYPATFTNVVMFPCDGARAPQRDAVSEREVSGFLVTTPTTLAEDRSGNRAAGCVVNNSNFTVLAYDCDSGAWGSIPPRGTNCSADPSDQQDWDFVLLGSRWWKIAGSALDLIPFTGTRNVCTIGSDGTAAETEENRCTDTGPDLPAMPC